MTLRNLFSNDQTICYKFNELNLYKNERQRKKLLSVKKTIPLDSQVLGNT
jgi:hypothetical protein